MGFGGKEVRYTTGVLLVGADNTAHTFVAIPSLYYGSGALGFYAVPYVAMTFGIALLTKCLDYWVVSRNRGYVTCSGLHKGQAKQ